MSAAIASSPELAEPLRFLRAYALYRQHKLEDTLSVLGEESSSTAVRLLRAQALYKRGQYSSAADLYLSLAGDQALPSPGASRVEDAMLADGLDEESLRDLLANLANTLVEADRSREVLHHRAFALDALHDAFELRLGRSMAEAAMGDLRTALQRTIGAEAVCVRVLRTEDAPASQVEAELAPLREQRAVLLHRLLHRRSAHVLAQDQLRTEATGNPAMQAVLWSLLAAGGPVQAAGWKAVPALLNASDVLKRTRASLNHEQAHRLTPGQRRALCANEAIALAVTGRSEEAGHAAEQLARDGMVAAATLVRALVQLPPFPRNARAGAIMPFGSWTEASRWATEALALCEGELREFLQAASPSETKAGPMSVAGLFGSFGMHGADTKGDILGGGVPVVCFLAQLLATAGRWGEARDLMRSESESPKGYLPSSVAFVGPVLGLRWRWAALAEEVGASEPHQQQPQPPPQQQQQQGSGDVEAALARISPERLRALVEREGGAEAETWWKSATDVAETERDIGRRSMVIAKAQLFQAGKHSAEAISALEEWCGLADACAPSWESLCAKTQFAAAAALHSGPGFADLLQPGGALGAASDSKSGEAGEGKDDSFVEQAVAAARNLARDVDASTVSSGSATVASDADALERAGLPESWWPSDVGGASVSAPALGEESTVDPSIATGTPAATTGPADGSQGRAPARYRRQRSKEAEKRRRERKAEKYREHLREKLGKSPDAPLPVPNSERWIPKNMRRAARKGRRRGPRYTSGGGAQGGGGEGQADARLDARARELAGQAGAPAEAGAGQPVAKKPAAKAAGKRSKKGGKRR